MKPDEQVMYGPQLSLFTVPPLSFDTWAKQGAGWPSLDPACHQHVHIPIVSVLDMSSSGLTYVARVHVPSASTCHQNPRVWPHWPTAPLYDTWGPGLNGPQLCCMTPGPWPHWPTALLYDTRGFTADGELTGRL